MSQQPSPFPAVENVTETFKKLLKTPATLRAAIRDGLMVDAPVSIDGIQGTTSLLMAAVKKRNKGLIEELLVAKASPNLADSNNITPAQLCVKYGMTDIAPLFLAAGALMPYQTLSLEEALEEALALSKIDSVRSLLKAGADVNSKKFKIEPLKVVMAQGNTAMLNVLLDAKAELNSAHDLTLAVMHPKKSTELVSLLLAHKADVNAVNFMGATPLHIAVKMVIESSDLMAQTRAMSTLQVLIQKGADLNAQDVAGQTPFAQAMSSPLFKKINAFTASGIPPHLVPPSTLAPKEAKISAASTSSFSSSEDISSVSKKKKKSKAKKVAAPAALDISDAAFLKAIQTGDLAQVKKLMAAEANVKAVDDQQNTPIMLAILSEKPDVANYLLEISNAELQASNASKQTVLHLAVIKNYMGLVHKLLPLLTPEALNAQDENGDSALILMAKNKTIGADSIGKLISAKASPDLQNKAGLTAFKLAESPPTKKYLQTKTKREAPVSIPKEVTSEVSLLSPASLESERPRLTDAKALSQRKIKPNPAVAAAPNLSSKSSAPEKAASGLRPASMDKELPRVTEAKAILQRKAKPNVAVAATQSLSSKSWAPKKAASGLHPASVNKELPKVTEPKVILQRKTAPKPVESAAPNPRSQELVDSGASKLNPVVLTSALVKEPPVKAPVPAPAAQIKDTSLAASAGGLPAKPAPTAEIKKMPHSRPSAPPGLNLRATAASSSSSASSFSPAPSQPEIAISSKAPAVAASPESIREAPAMGGKLVASLDGDAKGTPPKQDLAAALASHPVTPEKTSLGVQDGKGTTGLDEPQRLIRAVETGDLITLMDFLERIDEPEVLLMFQLEKMPKQQSLLHLSIENGRLQTTKLLLLQAQKLNLNLAHQDIDGSTTLMAALRKRDEESVRLLMKNSQKILYTVFHVDSPSEQLSLVNIRDREKLTPLMEAVSWANTNPTPTMLQLVQDLLAAGADSSAFDAEGYMVDYYTNNLDIADLIRKARLSLKGCAAQPALYSPAPLQWQPPMFNPGLTAYPAVAPVYPVHSYPLQLGPPQQQFYAQAAAINPHFTSELPPLEPYAEEDSEIEEDLVTTALLSASVPAASNPDMRKDSAPKQVEPSQAGVRQLSSTASVSQPSSSRSQSTSVLQSSSVMWKRKSDASTAPVTQTSVHLPKPPS